MSISEKQNLLALVSTLFYLHFSPPRRLKELVYLKWPKGAQQNIFAVERKGLAFIKGLNVSSWLSQQRFRLSSSYVDEWPRPFLSNRSLSIMRCHTPRISYEQLSAITTQHFNSISVKLTELCPFWCWTVSVGCSSQIKLHCSQNLISCVGTPNYYFLKVSLKYF